MEHSVSSLSPNCDHTRHMHKRDILILFSIPRPVRMSHHLNPILKLLLRLSRQRNHVVHDIFNLVYTPSYHPELPVNLS